MDISFKLSFLRTLGISHYEIPYNFLETCLSYTENTTELERWFTNSDTLSLIGAEKVCIKNIIGTNHPSYENKSWIDAFLNTKKGEKTIELYKSHPSYYFNDLKQVKQSSLIHDTPLEVFKIDHEYYIKGGNNRILLLKMLYFSELNRIKLEADKNHLSPTEVHPKIEEVEEKYSFYMQVNKVPENKEVLSLIFYLQKMGMHFKKRGKEDCHYQVSFEKNCFNIQSLSELKQLFKNSFSLTTISTKVELIDKLEQMTNDYLNTIPSLGLTKLFLELFPNFEKFKDYYLYAKKNNLEEILKSCNLTNFSYQNLFLYFEKVFLEGEKKSFEALFTNYKSFSELYEKVNSHAFTKNRIKQDLILQEFIFTFNKVVNFLDNSYLPRTYEDSVRYIINSDLKRQYHLLLPELELEEKLKAQLKDLYKLRTILEHKEALIPLCSQYENAKRNIAQEKTYAHIENENLLRKQKNVTAKKEELTELKKKKGLKKAFCKKERNAIESALVQGKKEKREIENALLLAQKNTVRNKHILENCLKELRVLLPEDVTFEYVESILQENDLSIAILYKKITDMELQLRTIKASQKLEQLKKRALSYGMPLENSFEGKKYF